MSKRLVDVKSTKVDRGSLRRGLTFDPNLDDMKPVGLFTDTSSSREVPLPTSYSPVRFGTFVYLSESHVVSVIER